MSNFYTDNESLKFYLNHPVMEKIVALKERDYAEKNVYPDSPADYCPLRGYRLGLPFRGDTC